MMARRFLRKIARTTEYFFPKTKDTKANVLGDEPPTFPIESATESLNFPDTQASVLGDEPPTFPIESATESLNFPDTQASVLGDEPPTFDLFDLLGERNKEKSC
ncbi:uncharacterized protein LOC111405512 [Olea europaea var. sylvestris]|uniref:Uncharacterized protein n=1 Tax=Olea europaea subsp. europaea TaxID=158383 RepID=A0A8S0URI4_OLEEU|nr:uncharacterized protein LOC111405512 [Olea europaea var. sylvestris]CAA3019132.1 Hypothetical predicted protein [Olea europaea subsp. europaea]